MANLKKKLFVKTDVMCSSCGDFGDLELSKVEKALSDIEKVFAGISPEKQKIFKKSVKTLSKYSGYPYRTMEIGGTIIVKLPHGGEE